jgi:hypothetical protein
MLCNSVRLALNGVTEVGGGPARAIDSVGAHDTTFATMLPASLPACRGSLLDQTKRAQLKQTSTRCFRDAIVSQSAKVSLAPVTKRSPGPTFKITGISFQPVCNILHALLIARQRQTCRLPANAARFPA